MPITKSAKKSLRQDLRRRKENVRRQKKMRSLKKEIIHLSENSKLKEARALLTSYYKAVDKAAKTNVIKKNTADRRKSRLVTQLNKVRKTSTKSH